MKGCWRFQAPTQTNFVDPVLIDEIDKISLGRQWDDVRAVSPTTIGEDPSR